MSPSPLTPMPQSLDISLAARPGDRHALVVSKYNGDITGRLRDAAVKTLVQHGVNDENILDVPVSGSFEIPLVAERLAASGRFDTVICLGAVIQGETTHHEYINHQVAAGIRAASQRSGVPIAFGVLTCQNLELAQDRAGGRMGNKGHEAALAALETLATLRAIDADAENCADASDSGSSSITSEAGESNTGDADDTTSSEEDGEVNTDSPDPRRRQAREAALQALYQVDLNPEMPPAAVHAFLDDTIADPALRAFAGQIVRGVGTRQEDLDRRIAACSDNWSIDRMAGTDRNVLRLAAWELFHSDVPYRVVLDEAIELARLFGDARSPGFVNGVLDALVPGSKKDLPEAASQVSAESA